MAENKKNREEVVMTILIAMVITYTLVFIAHQQEKAIKKRKTSKSRRDFEKMKKHVTLDGSYTRNGVRYTREGTAFWAYCGSRPILEEDGYTKDGYDYYGYDREGYDREGYNEKGYNRKGERKEYTD